MNSVYIVDYQRTPIGKLGGKLSTNRPDDLAAETIKHILQRNPNLPPAHIDEVILGCANQAGEDNRNVARFATLLAGLPVNVPANTVNRLCASGMQAIINGFAMLRAGMANVVVAGGVESMSRAPYVMGKAQKNGDRTQRLYDTTLGWRFINPKFLENYQPLEMGETAEEIAQRWGISRQRQDEFALSSHQKYVAAYQQGVYNEELLQPEGWAEGEPLIDEGVRFDTSLEKLAKLKTVFKTNGTVTAGNASGLNDGASAMLLATEEAVNKYNLQPLAKVVAASAAGVHPDIMGTGPIQATQKLLQQTGLAINDIDLFEINEAYASQVLCCIDELQIPKEKLNVNGGALAIGHPLGCSGNRITGHLALELKRRKARYGIATMCVGLGQGTAILIENINN